MTRVILCAGLNRSGSTWQLNAVRALLQEADPTLTVYASWIAEYDAANSAAVHLVKVHRVADAADMQPAAVVSSYRDLRAVAGSLVRMGWSAAERQPIRNHLDAYVAEAEQWRARADYVMAYEHLLERPLDTLADLAQSLRLELDQARLVAVLIRVEVLTPNSSTPAGNLSTVDRRTQLHDGHIGDKTDRLAIARLPASVLVDIEDHYGDWLLARGYHLVTR